MVWLSSFLQLGSRKDEVARLWEKMGGHTAAIGKNEPNASARHHVAIRHRHDAGARCG